MRLVPSPWHHRHNTGPQKLTRQGYTFSGWNTSPDGTGKSNAEGITYAKSADLLLYAKWDVIEVQFSNQVLPEAKLGKPYETTTATAKAGGAHLVYEKMSGRLPAGVNFNFPFGTVSGVPKEKGTFSFVVKAKTNTGQYKEAMITLTVR